jgi:uncharacterized membrane protein
LAKQANNWRKYHNLSLVFLSLMLRSTFWRVRELPDKGLQVMERLVKKTALGIAGMLTLLALPAYSTTAITLDVPTNGAGSSFSATSGSVLVDAFSYGSSTLDITSGEDLVLGFVNSSSPSLTLNNTSGATSFFSGVAPSASLLDATTGLSIMGTQQTSSPPSMLNITFTDSTVYVLPTAFVNDLVAHGVLASGTPDEFTVSGSLSGAVGSINSSTVELTQVPASLPESSSMFLFGAELLVIAPIAIWRRLRVV